MKRVLLYAATIIIFILTISACGEKEVSKSQTNTNQNNQQEENQNRDDQNPPEESKLILPDAYYFLIKYDPSATPDKQVSIIEINSNGTEVTITTASNGGKFNFFSHDKHSSNLENFKPSDAPSIIPVPGSILKLIPVANTLIEHNGATSNPMGIKGFYYIKDGDLYYYEHGITDPVKIDLPEKINDIESSSLPGIIKATTSNGDSWFVNGRTNKILQYSAYVSDDDDSYTIATKYQIVYFSDKAIGAFFRYTNSPGSSLDKVEYCDLENFDCTDVTTILQGKEIWQAGINYDYYYTEEVDTSNNKFRRQYYALDKQNLPQVVFQTLSEKVLSYNEMLGLPPSASGYTYMFSNSNLEKGDFFYEDEYSYYECNSPDKFQCASFVALQYYEDEEFPEESGYYVIAAISLDGIKRKLSLFPYNIILTDKGLIGYTKQDTYNNYGNVISREVTIKRLFNGQVSTLVTLHSSDFLADGSRTYHGNFQIINMGLYSSDLIYTIKINFSTPYTGPTKPYPDISKFQYIPTSNIGLSTEHGFVEYYDDYMRCEGTYFKQNGENNISDFRCYYDENKDGTFTSGNDIICFGPEIGGQFESDDCSFVNGDIYWLVKICKTNINTTNLTGCPSEIHNSVYKYEEEEIDNYILFGKYAVITSNNDTVGRSYAIDLENGYFANLTDTVLSFPLSTGYENGFDTGWYLGYQNGSLAVINDKLEVAPVTISLFYPGMDTKASITPIVSLNTFNVFLHTYPKDMYYPYTTRTEFPQTYSIYMFLPSHAPVKIWEDSFVSGNGVLGRQYKLIGGEQNKK